MVFFVIDTTVGLSLGEGVKRRCRTRYQADLFIATHQQFHEGKLDVVEADERVAARIDKQLEVEAELAETVRTGLGRRARGTR